MCRRWRIANHPRLGTMNFFPSRKTRSSTGSDTSLSSTLRPHFGLRLITLLCTTIGLPGKFPGAPDGRWCRVVPFFSCALTFVVLFLFTQGHAATNPRRPHRLHQTAPQCPVLNATQARTAGLQSLFFGRVTARPSLTARQCVPSTCMVRGTEQCFDNVMLCFEFWYDLRSYTGVNARAMSMF